MDTHKPYDHINWRGVTLNRRTAAMLEWVEDQTGIKIEPAQGSYNKGGVSASAGTHDGGGAIDIRVRQYTDKERNKVLTAMRAAGFAAWYRPEVPDLWGPHIHGIAIGDKDVASGAAQQLVAYKNGRDGLSGNRPDSFPHPDPQPVWDWETGGPVIPGGPVFKPEPVKPAPKPKPVLPKVKAADVQYGSKGPAVEVVQAALVKVGFPVVVDGVFGTQSRRAYQAYQKSLGLRGSMADGVPGVVSLFELAKRTRLFTLVK